MRVVVSFVVVLAVGATVVFMSMGLLNQSEDSIENLIKNAGENQLIEKSAFEETEVKALALQCYEDSHGVHKENLCYILRAEFDIDAVTHDKVEYSPQDTKTMFIRYKSEDGKVHLE